MNTHRNEQGSSLSGLGRFLGPAILAGAFFTANAEAPRVLPEGQPPRDQRLQPLKDLDGYFPFTVPATVEEWEGRAEKVRRQLLVTLGLWPMPSKTPLRTVVHGKIDRGDYTVEKVYFESYPGLYVTGNLYRPKGKSGRLPGVLSPHGHWPNGRFHDVGPERVRREIEEGAERFEEGGRSPLQARCVQLARMGAVVFHYDMLGYADSRQLSYELTHRFAKQRPEMNTLEGWGFYSTPAESRLQTVMGLQTYMSIRALDFLTSLPDVDPARIGVTGASGGGTQTFILCALDHRPAVSFPAVMVSTAMQGGCTCENASLLRVGTGNIEFAALFAPKPQGLTAANDWTREMETKGFPELKEHYTLMGAPENVVLEPLLHFGHNFNYVSRAAMYGLFNKHLGLGSSEPVVEEDYQRLSTEEMTVWNEHHPLPESGPDFERKLVRWITEDSDRQIARAAESPRQFRRLIRPAIDAIIGRGLAETGEVEFDLTSKRERDHFIEMLGLLKNRTHGEELPIVFLYPKEWSGQTVIWIHGEGKASLYTGANGQLAAPVQELVDAGATVIGVDLLFQGEFLTDGEPVTRTRRVENPREYAGYTFGYNHTLFAQRVHDILSVIQLVKNHERPSERVDLIGLGGAGPLAAAARAQAGLAVDRLALDSGGFRFAQLLDFHDPNFLPGGAKYGDLPGLLALSAPGKLWLAGEGEAAPDLVQKIYQGTRAESNLTLHDGPEEEVAKRAAGWLLNGK